jgi:hypothetical protein
MIRSVLNDAFESATESVIALKSMLLPSTSLTSVNAWRINREIADSSGAFTVGDEIKVTLLLDESVILANIGSNKIVVCPFPFFLFGHCVVCSSPINIF